MVKNRIDISAPVGRSITSRSPKPMYFSHAGSNPGSPHFFIYFYLHNNMAVPCLTCVCVCGRGGRTSPLWIHHWIGPPVRVLSFFLCRLGLSIYRLTKKILGISGKYLKFLQPQKLYSFCTFTLRKDPEIHRKDP